MHNGTIKPISKTTKFSCALRINLLSAARQTTFVLWLMMTAQTLTNTAQTLTNTGQTLANTSKH